MSVSSSWFIVLLKSSVFLFIIYLVALHTIESDVLNSTITVELSISPFLSVSFASCILVLYYVEMWKQQKCPSNDKWINKM